MFWLTIVLSSFAYLFVAGVVHKNFYPWRVRSCSACNSARRCGVDHSGAAFFASALWPLALPVCLGTYGMSILGVSHGGKTRDERRRESELAEARHKVELARLSQQQTEALERAAM